MRRIGLVAALLAAPLCAWSQSAVPALPSAPPTVQAPGSSAADAVAGGTIEGVVRAGQTPLQGVTVTAENTLTGNQ